MNKKTNKHIDWSLISRNLSGKLSDSEKEEFQEWLENNLKHKNYVEQSISFYTKLEHEGIDRPDVDKAIAQFKLYTEKSKTRGVNFNRLLKYAAVILIPLCIAIFAILQTSDVQDDILASGIEIIKSGASRAELLMADGQVLSLDKKDTLVRELDGTQIQNLSGILKYQSNQKLNES